MNGSKQTRQRRMMAAMVVAVVAICLVVLSPDNYDAAPPAQPDAPITTPLPSSASQALSELAIKGRAPKTGYARANFGTGWAKDGSCDTRNLILERDIAGAVRDDQCRVVSGTLHDPYTGQTIAFVRGPTSSQAVQIDHVVALSDAWQKGAQGLTLERRVEFANDPLNLLAVDGPANQQKGDGDAATWLPPNRVFRCQYVARQIAVKHKYELWVTQAEHDAMAQVLTRCPGQQLPRAELPGG